MCQHHGALVLVLCLGLGGAVLPRGVRAEDDARSASTADPDLHAASAARTLLWLSASATLLSASLAGLYALRVSAIYDRSMILAPVSPELSELHGKTLRAERTADALFITTAVLASTTLVALLLQPSNDRARSASPRLLLTANTHGAGVVYKDHWP
jgi:hypothetical protein